MVVRQLLFPYFRIRSENTIWFTVCFKHFVPFEYHLIFEREKSDGVGFQKGFYCSIAGNGRSFIIAVGIHGFYIVLLQQYFKNVQWFSYSYADRTTYGQQLVCLLYTSPSPRDGLLSRMPSSA